MRFVFWLPVLTIALMSCDKKSEGSSHAAPGVSLDPSGSQPPPPTSPKVERLDFPGTEEGARALLEAFLKPDADRVTMTRSLRPSAEDYAAIFVTDVLPDARAKYNEQWDKDIYTLDAKEGQTELHMWKATTEQFRDWAGDANEFPRGYQKVVDKLKPGLTFYRFKFVKPGDKHGSTYDGLVFINGHWVLVSKPYRVI